MAYISDDPDEFDWRIGLGRGGLYPTVMIPCPETDFSSVYGLWSSAVDPTDIIGPTESAWEWCLRLGSGAPPSTGLLL